MSDRGDDGDGGDAEGSRDLYAALRLPRDASKEDIKRAYRTLAASLHPDKQRRRQTGDADDDGDDQEARRDAAQRAFAALSEAYEILSDDARRNAYDAYGMEGVRAGRELATRGKTLEELRVEFERARAKEARDAAEAKLNFHGTYIFGFSAAHLVEERIAERRRQFTNNPGLDLTSASLSNSMEIPISDEDAAYAVTQGTMRGGRGAGNFILGWRRTFSPLTTLDLSAQTGQTSACTATMTRQLTTHTTGALSWNYVAQQGLGLQLIAQRQLFAQTRGHLTWNVGPVGSMSTGASHAFGKNAVKFDLTVGLAASGLSGHYVRQMDESRVYRLGWKLGTTGAELEAGTTNKVDEDTSLGCSIVVSLRGLTLKFRMNRQGQRFVIPILLTPMVSWRKSLVAFTLPPLAITLLRYFLVRPMVRRYVRKRQIASREKSKQSIVASMKAARDAVRVIEESVDKKTKIARERGGLVIEAAVYGSFDPRPNKVKGVPIIPNFDEYPPREERDASGATNVLPPPFIDVTKAVAFMIENDTLDMYENVPMSDLLGFCDPSPGEDKFLRIRYRYRRSLHEITVKADAMVAIPNSAHRLPERLQIDEPHVASSS